METIKAISFEIEGWEIEIEIPIEFTACPGYPATQDEPGEPEHVEEIVFDEEIVKPIIKGEIAQIELMQVNPIEFDMQIALDDLQEELDNNDILHIELLDIAREGNY